MSDKEVSLKKADPDLGSLILDDEIFTLTPNSKDFLKSNSDAVEEMKTKTNVEIRRLESISGRDLTKEEENRLKDLSKGLESLDEFLKS